MQVCHIIPPPQDFNIYNFFTRMSKEIKHQIYPQITKLLLNVLLANLNPNLLKFPKNHYFILKIPKEFEIYKYWINIPDYSNSSHSSVCRMTWRLHLIEVMRKDTTAI